ncbi:hypothetical protein [Caballeronia sp. GAFFF3]|uniref:hypothetical protein n=1 Tax=Caballeronia sp. GAFFF3 TaxID=2921759 RepID=UPI0020280A34|nr:hypothetical protein [Caballeronia sp. GAFFF3]
MATVYLQFTDETHTKILSYFTCPQDPEQYPHQGTLETDDPLYRDYYESLPLVAQQGMPDPSGGTAI